MGSPAIVSGNVISGTCTNHLIPSASGTQPAGPLPFAAPLTSGLSGNVQIGGQPAAVVGSSGLNSPPHPGIVDAPFASPSAQMGRIASGSTSVLIGGQPAATTQSQALCCVAKGTVGPGVPTVEIG
jgi:uncharacterized Zn-binding protein involved in type VI secretion